MPLRISIRVLLGLVLIVALEIAALRLRSVTWAAAAMSLTILMLALGLLGALFRRGLDRAFWIGFTLFGTAYVLAASFAPDPEQFLVTAGLLDLLEERIHPPVPMYAINDPNEVHPMQIGDHKSMTEALARIKESWDRGNRNVPDPATLSIYQFSPDAAPREEHDAFDRTGHALFALVCAYIGGLGARYFASPPRDPARGRADGRAGGGAHTTSGNAIGESNP